MTANLSLPQHVLAPLRSGTKHAGAFVLRTIPPRNDETAMRTPHRIVFKLRHASAAAIISALVAAALFLTLGQFPRAATPGAISIDFVGQGVPMGPAEIAGVVAKANWNNATGAVRTSPLALKNETGAATTATVSWIADNTWSTPIADQPGNPRLMKGYIDNGFERTTTVTVAGLPPGPYDVYVYVDGDSGASRTGGYQISGTGITTTTINLTDPGGTYFNGTFTQANNSDGNYVKFRINAGGFTLQAIPGPSADGRKRAPVNGIQIVAGSQPGPPPPPDFTMSASPASQSVTQGNSVSYAVTV